MDIKQKEEIEFLIKKVENGELSEEEELTLLKGLDFSYDVLNKFLEEIKIAKLSADLKN
jgi:hypothetical protein